MSARRSHDALRGTIAIAAGLAGAMGVACSDGRRQGERDGEAAPPPPSAIESTTTPSADASSPPAAAATSPAPTPAASGPVTTPCDDARTSPTEVPGLTGAVEVAAVLGRTCARRDDGTVWRWGATGPLRPIPGVVGAVRLPSAEVALLADGHAMTLDRLERSEAVVDAAGPMAGFVTQNADFRGAEICARDEKDGTVSCNGHTLPGFRDATRLDAGENALCAIFASGAVSCFGSNAFGRLGGGDFGTQHAYGKATPIPALRGASSIAIGHQRSCATRTDGSVICWGSGLGTLGTAVTDQPVPAPIAGLSAVAELALGSEHTCARHTDGTVSCWGWNDRGQLGDGTTHQRMLPVKVPGLAGIKQLAAGDWHTCALRRDGKVLCWGSNAWGQIGVPSVGCCGDGDNRECEAGCCEGLVRDEKGVCR